MVKNRSWTYSLFIVGVFLMFSSCSKKNDKVPTPTTVTDIDGNVYHTVTIGTQVWMVENLKVTRYRNGDLIGTTTPATLDISSESTPKYQWAYNGDENNVATYGRLYTWYAITDSRNICPIGWHVPSDAEWTILTDLLGGEFLAGGKLKETGILHWQSPNIDATNSSGFTALPGGTRVIDGTFNFLTSDCEMWTSTEENLLFARNSDMGSMTGNWLKGSIYKTNGLSCRCLRN